MELSDNSAYELVLSRDEVLLLVDRLLTAPSPEAGSLLDRLSDCLHQS